jgi:demethylmenaquinone methyltransferase/2-methoxy-6-polyprenyl-1,4-benzoquinol methylase
VSAVNSAGTTPEGARNEQEASRWVRSMFGRVAHRYDLANHLLSANIDKSWRARTVAKVRDILRRPDAHAIDLACGTGDLLVAANWRGWVCGRRSWKRTRWRCLCRMRAWT